MNNNEKEELEEENDYIESVGLKATYYNDFVQRYFEKYYIDKGKETEQYIFIHTNGIIICGLGSNHFLIKSKINSITDLKKLGKITGKRKHGAHFLNDNEYVIQINYNDNQTYNFCPKIRGKLIEINKNIINDGSLINNFPEKYGFVCIVLMDNDKLEKLKTKLSSSNNNSE